MNILDAVTPSLICSWCFRGSPSNRHTPYLNTTVAMATDASLYYSSRKYPASETQAAKGMFMVINIIPRRSKMKWFDVLVECSWHLFYHGGHDKSATPAHGRALIASSWINMLLIWIGINYKRYRSTYRYPAEENNLNRVLIQCGFFILGFLTLHLQAFCIYI